MNLFVPYIAPSTNQMYAGQHWRKRVKHKSDALSAVAGALFLSGQSNKRFANPVSISIKPILGKGKRGYDVSNYSYTFKLIEDCLVKKGILKDDTASFVTEVRFLAPQRGKGSGVILEIVENI